MSQPAKPTALLPQEATDEDKGQSEEADEEEDDDIETEEEDEQEMPEVTRPEARLKGTSNTPSPCMLCTILRLLNSKSRAVLPGVFHAVHTWCCCNTVIVCTILYACMLLYHDKLQQLQGKVLKWRPGKLTSSTTCARSSSSGLR